MAGWGRREAHADGRIWVHKTMLTGEQELHRVVQKSRLPLFRGARATKNPPHAKTEIPRVAREDKRLWIKTFRRFSALRRFSLALRLVPMHFVQQFCQYLSPLVAVQFATQLFECQCNDVIVVSAAIRGIGGNVEPHLVHEFDILRTHPRGVGSERVFVDSSSGLVNLQSQSRSGFRQTFPRVPELLGLLVGGELVGEPTDDAARVQALGSYDNCLKDIGSRDYKQ